MALAARVALAEHLASAPPQTLVRCWVVAHRAVTQLRLGSLLYLSALFPLEHDSGFQLDV